MDGRDVYIERLEKTIKNLQEQVSNLTEIVMLLRKEKFAPSSEKAGNPHKGQLSLFHEAEIGTGGAMEEPTTKPVKGYLRKGTKTKREELLKGLPVIEIECDIPAEGQSCIHCGKPMKRIGKETVREELEYIPAKLQIIRYIRWSYSCPSCKRAGQPYIVKAQVPTSLMNHSLASPSSAAGVMYEKYVNGVPLYRQEKTWKQMGVALSRATMANWVIRCSEDYFKPVVDHMRKQLLSRDIIHCDETPVQVLKEEGKKPQTKSYMWLYRTGIDDGKPVVLYDYQPSRNGDHAAAFLKDFKGYVHSDGYSGYNKLAGVTRCGCWAHLRRKFIEAVPQKKGTGGLTNAETGRNYCDQLFMIERKLKDVTPEERRVKRLELEKPVLEAFWRWLENLDVLKGSALGKAAHYAMNQRKYMENYLLDGRCSISNNAAENAIRPFTVGRKNWLFADTPKGASASAAIYSIVETAKANGINVYMYLKYLLQHMPVSDWRSRPEDLEDLMPWSEKVQMECK